jgi:hypothetical protein
MRALAVGLASLLLAGCAAMKNTTQQEIAWDAYHQCQYEGRIPNNVQMVRVEPDGRYWYEWMNGSHGSTDFVQCISEKSRAIAAARPAGLPTGRLSYATEVTTPDVPSIRVFLLAADKPGCESAIASIKAASVEAKSPPKFEFGKCREATLTPGSDYWAVAANALIPGNPVVIGGTAQQFCESTAKQYVGTSARCSPTSIRFTQP